MFNNPEDFGGHIRVIEDVKTSGIALRSDLRSCKRVLRLLDEGYIIIL